VDALFLTLVDNCANDMYWSILWDEHLMKQSACVPLHNKILFEQKDIWCASTKLAQETDVTEEVIAEDRRVCATCDPALLAGEIVLEELGEVNNLVSEIQSSLDAITKMTFSACSDYEIPDLGNFDCGTHVFRNTDSWSCGVPVAPPHAEFGTCDTKEQGDSCTAACSTSYTRAHATQSGVSTCTPVQGTGVAGVDITMEWTSPTLVCVECKECNAEKEVQSQQCSSNQDTVCTCKPGYYIHNGGCTACAPGTFSDHAGATSCTPCSAGITFTSTSANSQCSSCTPCPAGEVTNVECAANKDRTCKCAPGFAGAPGACSACSPPQFSDVAGLATCKSCGSCDGAKEVVANTCINTRDTVCECKAGFMGESGDCRQCVSGLSYSAQSGQETCDRCMICNSKSETATSDCTLTANTQCQCNLPGAAVGETCYEFHNRQIQ